MKRLAGIMVVSAATVALAGWYFHDRWRAPAPVSPPPPAAAVRQKPDVLYTWVDRDGVTHYEQESGRGTRVVYDGSRITPLVTPSAPPRKRIAAATDAVKEQTGQGLHKLRNELGEGAQRMREARAASSPDL